MSKESLCAIIKNPYKIFQSLGYHGLLNCVPDDKYLKLIWKSELGTNLDLDNPKTFNEKLQWLKLYNRCPEYTQMVDKYNVREYIQKKVGGEYLIPLYGVWNKAEDIDFDLLPKQFVLKCNHDSGSIIICKDKSTFNKTAAIKQLNKHLKTGAYWPLREWPYKNVKPCILAEKYMKDLQTDVLLDYKFYCFNGEPKFLYIGCANFINGVKHDLLTFKDLQWNATPFYRTDHEQIPFDLEKPALFDNMIEIAKKLSEGIPFLRVDLYYINGHIYFSELTFYPGSGLGPFKPHKWEMEIGEWLKLPKKVL